MKAQKPHNRTETAVIGISDLKGKLVLTAVTFCDSVDFRKTVF